MGQLKLQCKAGRFFSGLRNQRTGFKATMSLANEGYPGEAQEMKPHILCINITISLAKSLSVHMQDKLSKVQVRIKELD